jgi:hypothetical protein
MFGPGARFGDEASAVKDFEAQVGCDAYSCGCRFRTDPLTGTAFGEKTDCTV